MDLVNKIKANKPAVVTASLGLFSAIITGSYVTFSHPLAALGAGAATAGVFYDAVNLYKNRQAGLATAVVGSLGYGLATADNYFVLAPQIESLVPMAGMTAITLGVLGTLERLVTPLETETKDVASA